MNIWTTFIDRMRDSLRDMPLWRIWPMPLLELIGLCVFFHVTGDGTAVVMFLNALLIACGAGYVIRRTSVLRIGLRGLELRFVAIFPKALTLAFLFWLTMELSGRQSIQPAIVTGLVLPILGGFLFHTWWAPEFEARRPKS